MWTKRPPRLQGFNYQASRTYFVTFCVRDREPVFKLELAAQIAVAAVLRLRQQQYYWLYAYCVMPNHIHLIFKKAKARSLQSIVATLKRSIWFQCRRAGVPIRWQSSFYDRIVREYEMSDAFVKYVLLNPVRAGLVHDFSDYKYSGRIDRWS
jgi:putative transposase